MSFRALGRGKGADIGTSIAIEVNNAVSSAGGQVQIGSHSLDKLSKAGQAMDRSGLTKADQAFHKHGNRSPTVYPKPQGNVLTRNQRGQYILDNVLTHLNSITTYHKTSRYGEFMDIKIPGHQGARYDFDGKFIGFLEP